MWGLSASPLLDEKGERYGTIESIGDITQSKKEEIRLKKSEKRLNTIVESATDVIITTDDKGNILYYNTKMKNIFGYLKEEIIDEKLTILIMINIKKIILMYLKILKFPKNIHMIKLSNHRVKERWY